MYKPTLSVGEAGISVTPELQCFIIGLFAGNTSPKTVTLSDLRYILLGNDLFISVSGEVMNRLDRTSLVIEVDDLIDGRGNETELSGLLPE